MIKKVRHIAISFREVFQALKPTQLVQSVAITIRGSVLQERKNVLGVVSSVHNISSTSRLPDSVG